MTTPPRGVLALVGLRCSGKTSVGRAVAESLGVRFVDLDDEVAAAAVAEGWPIECAPGEGGAGAVLSKMGEARFRAMEGVELSRCLEGEGPLVIATGGGCVEMEACREALKARTFCVWLKEEPEVLARRLREDPLLRPALGGGDAAEEMADVAGRREHRYAEVADVVVEGGGASARELAVRVEAEWGTTFA